MWEKIYVLSVFILCRDEISYQLSYLKLISCSRKGEKNLARKKEPRISSFSNSNFFPRVHFEFSHVVQFRRRFDECKCDLNRSKYEENFKVENRHWEKKAHQSNDKLIWNGFIWIEILMHKNKQLFFYFWWMFLYMYMIDQGKSVSPMDK